MAAETRKKVTVPAIRDAKGVRRIGMLTAYDYPSARQVDLAGADITLVGDSLGMVVLGYPDTLSVTMDDMLHHTRAVVRGTQSSLVVGDMPYMSYHVSVEDAVRNAGAFVRAGAQAVKIEGGKPSRIRMIDAIRDAEIPVMGHIGLTPQSVNDIGGFKVQGKDAEAAKRLMDEAGALEQAGCFSLVLECVPAEIAAYITESVKIPTIGIGAGPACDGQVLVYHDILGLFSGFKPKFVRRYASLEGEIVGALSHYLDDVREGRFPDVDTESFHVADHGELRALYGEKPAIRVAKGCSAMRICTGVDEIRDAVRAARAAGHRVGFVPTMGFLHEGHLSLVDLARQQGCGFIAVSIFVNPAQFGPNEDFARYPRNEARDIAQLEARGVDLLFLPGVSTIYPDGHVTRVRVGGVSEPLEGERRPGHFEGVATVVLKLFNIVRPDLAAFGRKDAQQCAVVERMVRDLDLPVELVFGETTRESDGLAMSSRNAYLSPGERELAPRFREALAEGVEAVRRGASTDEVESAMAKALAALPFEIDYLRLVDPMTFLPTDARDRDLLVVGAIRVGRTRLIDNIRVPAPAGEAKNSTF